MSEQQAQLQQVQQAFALAQLPTFFFNGFNNSFSATEITSVLSFGPKPILLLAMTPSVAKTFALAVLESIEQYETASGVSVPTLQELTERIAVYQAENP